MKISSFFRIFFVFSYSLKILCQSQNRTKTSPEASRSPSKLLQLQGQPESPMAAMIPDPCRKWIKGTAYITAANEYSKDGTCIGIGTREVTAYGRAVGVCYASPLPKREEQPLGDLFLEMFGY